MNTNTDLEEYAKLADVKLLAGQSDLNPKDHAMPEMLAWCRRQGNVVVLQDGSILSSVPTARAVQNCKIVMRERGLTPGVVYPTRAELLAMLLANAPEQDVQAEQLRTVTTQQQRLRQLVKDACDLEVTDIHIEVRRKIARIRMRKHGELFLFAEWMPKIAREVVSVAFNKETDNAISHFNPLVPQNASMPLQINQRTIRLRLASLPAQGGFDVVMRLLTLADEEVSSLEQLGYEPEQVSQIKQAVNMPYGAVIVSGPTGSGKTTTLASCMHLVDQQRKIFTIEDPVEKLIRDATQVPVNTEHYDRSFASMARTVLRMDPDLIVLGEMRDEESAHVLMRAAMTGHLVFSTLHTNAAMDVIVRLEDLGISRSLLASTNLLVCLVCQRLAPMLCPHCAKPAQKDHFQELEALYLLVKDSFDDVRVRGEDCEHCHGLGIEGRTIVSEIIWMDDFARECIQKNDVRAWQEHLQAQHWRSYRDRLLGLVKTGRCDPRDAQLLAGWH